MNENFNHAFGVTCGTTDDVTELEDGSLPVQFDALGVSRQLL